MKKKIIITSTVFICVFLLFSCAAESSKTRVKPDDTSKEPLGTSSASLSVISDVAEKNTPEYYITLYNAAEYAGLFAGIAAACSDYRVAYGTLPLKLDDLLDGFLLLWPVCPYTEQPAGIIYSMPDPANPKHIGKIYYDRLDDNNGNLYIINLDAASYEQGRKEWMVEEINIIHSLGPGVDAIDNLAPLDRYWAASNRLLDENLRKHFISAYIYDSGNPPTDFVKMLTGDGVKKFVILRNGLEKLQEGIASKKIVYEIGVVNNGEYYYVDTNHLRASTSGNGWELYRMRVCLAKGSDWDDLTQKQIYWMKFPDTGAKCPEGSKFTGVLFSSNDFGSYTFPDSVIITPDKISRN